MNSKLNLLNEADKELLSEYVFRSMGRVLNRTIEGWDAPIPQGVSVFTAHPDKDKFEYMFTKDDKYPVKKDDKEEVQELLHRYGNVKAGGLVLYMNSCMMPVVSKHRRYPY